MYTHAPVKVKHPGGGGGGGDPRGMYVLRNPKWMVVRVPGLMVQVRLTNVYELFCADSMHWILSVSITAENGQFGAGA